MYFYNYNIKQGGYFILGKLTTLDRLESTDSKKNVREAKSTPRCNAKGRKRLSSGETLIKQGMLERGGGWLGAVIDWTQVNVP